MGLQTARTALGTIAMVFKDFNTCLGRMAVTEIMQYCSSMK